MVNSSVVIVGWSAASEILFKMQAPFALEDNPYAIIRRDEIYELWRKYPTLCQVSINIYWGF